MRYEILLAPQAAQDMFCLRANVRAQVHDAMERHLRHEPRKSSRARIKQLRGLSRPQFRLRVGDDIRVFYDVTSVAVEVLAILPKSEANAWLERYGERDEASSTD